MKTSMQRRDLVSAYQERWQTYRRRRNLFFLLLATYIPCILLSRTAVEHGIGDSGVWYFFVMAWSTAAMMAGIWTNVLVCPRCGKLFFWGSWPHRGFLQRRCVHCGLSKFAEDSK